MPLRDSPIRAAGAAAAAAACRLRGRGPAALALHARPRLRPFHSSAPPRRDEAGDRSHYETLNVHPDASPAEIKKSFYALSKEHHPDHNRHDPHASRRFVRISEAYAVLSSADRRARYDRDVLGRHAQGRGPHQHGHPGHPGRGPGATGPAGGRPASGLSRRRGAFTGPPPSFFRSGGWGAHGARRRAAHEESTGGGGGSASTAGGMGPGQDPFGHAGGVPHFDREAHERTGRRADQRRAARTAGGDAGARPDAGMVSSFFLILGVLGAAVLGPYLALGGWKGKQKDRKGGAGKAGR